MRTTGVECAGAHVFAQILALRTTAVRYASQVLGRLGHPPLPSDPRTSGGLRTTVLGPDPVRVLLFGGDLAVGWGARTRHDALDGRLAASLAEQTGRGVILENRAVPHVHATDSMRSLGATGLHTATFGVWCPSWTELLEHPSARRWEHAVRGLVAGAAAGERPVPLVLLHMPAPSGVHPIALLTRPWIQRFNRVLDRVAHEHAHVVAVPTPSIEARDAANVVIDRAYYAAFAADLASVLVRILHGGVRTAA